MKNEDKINAIGSMIQFDSEGVYVSEHPDPLHKSDQKSGWISFEYEASKMSRYYTAKELPTVAGMFAALWELAILYDIPPKESHSHMLKVKEYHNIFHMVKAKTNY